MLGGALVLHLLYRLQEKSKQICLFPKMSNHVFKRWGKKSWKSVTVIHEHKLDLQMCFWELVNECRWSDAWTVFVCVIHTFNLCIVKHLLIKICWDILSDSQTKVKEVDLVTLMFSLTVNLPILPWILRLLTSLPSSRLQVVAEDSYLNEVQNSGKWEVMLLSPHHKSISSSSPSSSSISSLFCFYLFPPV